MRVIIGWAHNLELAINRLILSYKTLYKGFLWTNELGLEISVDNDIQLNNRYNRL